MILPATYAPTLLLALLALLCWGSWANAYKLTRGERFEIFYWDYALGVLLAALVAAFTCGSLGVDLSGDVGGFAFLDDISLHASKHSIAYGLAAGLVFNLGSILLAAALSLTGMSFALPVGLGLAIAGALVLDYVLNSHGNPLALFPAAVLLIAGVVVEVVAYRAVSLERAKAAIRTGKTKSNRVTASWQGIVLAGVGGLLMALCCPLLALSRQGEFGMGPYTAAVVFAVGSFVSTCIYNLFFMNLPVQGQPLELLQYFQEPARQHLLGVLGGIVWGAGTVSYFVASSAVSAGSAKNPPVLLLGPAAGYVLVLGAALVSALWGLLVWKEFAGATRRVRALLGATLALFAAALALILLAPPFTA